MGWLNLGTQALRHSEEPILNAFTNHAPTSGILYNDIPSITAVWIFLYQIQIIDALTTITSWPTGDTLFIHCWSNDILIWISICICLQMTSLWRKLHIGEPFFAVSDWLVPYYVILLIWTIVSGKHWEISNGHASRFCEIRVRQNNKYSLMDEMNYCAYFSE